MLQRYVLFNVWSISVTSVFLSLRCILLYHSLKSVNTYSVTCRSFMVVWLFSHSENVSFSDTWIHPMAEAKGLKTKVYVGYFIYFLRKICMKKMLEIVFRAHFIWAPISTKQYQNPSGFGTDLFFSLFSITYFSNSVMYLLVWETTKQVCSINPLSASVALI